MADLVSKSQGVLEEARFATQRSSVGSRSLLYFENDAIAGFLVTYETCGALLSEWRADERTLLIRHAGDIRAADDKAWNVYTALLCEEEGDEDLRRAIRTIEEDLSKTRKIAACGISTGEDVRAALMPILPIRYTVELGVESVRDRLAARIEAIAPGVSQAVLDDNIPAAQVIRLFGGDK